MRTSRLTSLLVKLGALVCVLFLNAQFAIDFQLLGGVFILQTFPALILGLLKIRFSAVAMLSGWLIGTVFGVSVCWMDGLKPIHPVNFGLFSGNVSTGLLALGVNILIVLVVSAFFPAKKTAPPHNRIAWKTRPEPPEHPNVLTKKGCSSTGASLFYIPAYHHTDLQAEQDGPCTRPLPTAGLESRDLLTHHSIKIYPAPTGWLGHLLINFFQQVIFASLITHPQRGALLALAQF